MTLEHEPNFSPDPQSLNARSEAEPISDFEDLGTVTESPSKATPEASPPSEPDAIPPHLSSSAALLGINTQAAEALHKAGQLEQFLMQQQMMRQYAGQMPPAGAPGFMPGMPMTGMPMGPGMASMGLPGMMPQQGYPGMQPAYPQMVQQPDESPMVPDFKVADDLSNVGDVVQQVHSYHNGQMQEMQSLLGAMYENMQQMQQQMQSAWLTEKISSLGDDGSEIFGDPQGQVQPYSPQAFARQQVTQAVESLRQYNPMLTRDQAFDMVVRSQWSGQLQNRQTDQAKRQKAPPVGRPNASASAKDAFSTVAEKMHRYRTQNGEY